VDANSVPEFPGQEWPTNDAECRIDYFLRLKRLKYLQFGRAVFLIFRNPQA
jgi:hypothetical protein